MKRLFSFVSLLLLSGALIWRRSRHRNTRTRPDGLRHPRCQPDDLVNDITTIAVRLKELSGSWIPLLIAPGANLPDVGSGTEIHVPDGNGIEMVNTLPSS